MPTHRTDDKWHWAIGGSVLLVLGVFAAIVYLYAEHPERDHTQLVTILVGLTSTTVLALLALLRTMDNAAELRENTTTTQATAETVSELANGSMDAKIRLAMAEVLAPDLIDPDARATLAGDQQRRTALDVMSHQLRQRLSEEPPS
jgi:hypothetical protein